MRDTRSFPSKAAAILLFLSACSSESNTQSKDAGGLSDGPAAVPDTTSQSADIVLSSGDSSVPPDGTEKGADVLTPVPDGNTQPTDTGNRLDSPATVADGTPGASSAYPNPATTGVPPGTVLTDLPLNNVDHDSYWATEPGAVIDSRHIAGNLLIRANDVVVKNSQIDGTVYNDFDDVRYRYTISDSTIGLEGGCITQPGLTYANYVATRVRIQGHDDGFRVSPPGNVTISDSFVKTCWAPPEVSPPDGSHSDGLQADCRGGICTGITFIHNTVDGRDPNQNTGISVRGFDSNLLSDVILTDNLVMGGGYAMVTVWVTGPNWKVERNSVVDKTWAYAPDDANGTCAHQNWADNRIVTIDDSYSVTSVVKPLNCMD